MKKLDDIPKKHPFNVPDDYFDKLPGQIQERVQGESRGHRPAFKHVLRYAIATVTIAIAAFVWIWTNPTPSDSESPEAILASVDTSELVAYINEGDITTDELLDGIRLDSEDANEIEGEVFNLNLDDSDIDNLLNEFD